MEARALVAGPLAADVLAAASFRVVAVFRRSLYLQGQGGELCCLGSMALERGPINVLCSPWDEASLPAPGDALRRTGSLLEGRHLRLGLEDLRIWSKPACRAAVPGMAARSLERLREVLSQEPREGLVRLFVAGWRPVDGDPLLTMALTAVQQICEGLRSRPARGDGTQKSGAALEAGVTGLLGLGPGLTPSGDDFLGGLLVALHRIGMPETALRLSGTIGRNAAGLTHLISRAHLAAAARGLGAEGLHTFIEALLAGADPDMARIDHIGHSSGWDAVTGVCLALEQNRFWREPVQDAE